MACLYRRRNPFRISYYVGGRQVQEPLHADEERIARAKKRRLEYEPEVGDLQRLHTSRLPCSCPTPLG